MLPQPLIPKACGPRRTGNALGKLRRFSSEANTRLRIVADAKAELGIGAITAPTAGPRWRTVHEK